MARMVGIDLGTTHSLCAVFDGEFPRLIPNALGEALTPSAVGMLDDGQIVVGRPALELRVVRPERCVTSFKRWMGTDREVEIGSKVFSPVELSAMVLKSLKADAETALGESVADAVITVPAYFGDNERTATKLAGEMAGLSVKRILNEPTAAALAYGLHDRDSEKSILVLDLGGGTFDVTVMDIFSGNLEIVATAGESFLGGDDFTDRLVAHCLEKVGRNLETAELKSPLLVSRLRRHAEYAKRELHGREQTKVRMPDEDGSTTERSREVEVDRATFARLCAPLVDKMARPIRKALHDSKRDPQKLDEILLVGGATRMTLCRDLVIRLFQKEPLCKFNPDEVVALGAAVQAALLQDNRAVDDMVVTDVCPHSLGCEITKTFGESHHQGYFLPIISRNTTVPVSRETTVYTLSPNQQQVVVNVYEGESRRVSDNRFLGKLTVEGIPRGPAGEGIVLRFSYDLNGILEVEAIVSTTGSRFRTVLTRGTTSLTRRQIEESIARLAAVKFYPRDDVKNRQLVLFAERVLRELGMDERALLERAIDEFEQGMSSGDRTLFDSAKSALLELLSANGFNPSAAEDDSHS